MAEISCVDMSDAKGHSRYLAAGTYADEFICCPEFRITIHNCKLYGLVDLYEVNAFLAFEHNFDRLASGLDWTGRVGNARTFAQASHVIPSTRSSHLCDMWLSVVYSSRLSYSPNSGSGDIGGQLEDGRAKVADRGDLCQRLVIKVVIRDLMELGGDN